jgi:hypothetical protein
VLQLSKTSPKVQSATRLNGCVTDALMLWKVRRHLEDAMTVKNVFDRPMC